MSEGRSPAQIEADIVRRRRQLAETLDELAVRVHPSTVAGDMRTRAAAAVNDRVGRAYVAANRAVEDLRGQFVTEKGAPRAERIVPVAVATLALVVVVGLSSRRRRR